MRSIFSSTKHEERLNRERIAAATWKPPGRTRKEEVGWKCKRVLHKGGAEMQRPPPKRKWGGSAKVGQKRKWGGSAKAFGRVGRERKRTASAVLKLSDILTLLKGC